MHTSTSFFKTFEFTVRLRATAIKPAFDWTSRMDCDSAEECKKHIDDLLRDHMENRYQHVEILEIEARAA